MGISNKVDNKSSFKHDRRYDTSLKVPRFFNQDGNTRKKRSDSGEVSMHSRSETELPDDAPIILTWVPKEKGRSLSDENLQIVIDHVNKYRETRKILLCINSSGFESKQKEAIRQKLDERLGDKAQQVKVIDLLEYDWSSVDQGWEIDGKDISIKDYYANIYSKALGERMYFPVEIDTFRMVALALSEQITGKRGAIYVDFDTLSAIKEPLGQGIRIPKGMLVGDVTAGNFFVESVNNDLIAIDQPKVAAKFLDLYKDKIKSEKTLCQIAKEILKLNYDGISLNELLEMHARGDLQKVLSFLFEGKGEFLIISHSEFRNYVDPLIKIMKNGYIHFEKELVSFEENGGKYPGGDKITHTFSWLDIPSHEMRVKFFKIKKYLTPFNKREASESIRELANYIRSVGYKIEVAKCVSVSTLLQLAIRIQDKSLVKDLIEMGDDVNARDSHGKTPLHLASEMGDLSLVSLLLENGAMHDAVDNKNEKVLDLSHDSGVTELLKDVDMAFGLIQGDHSSDNVRKLSELLAKPGYSKVLSNVKNTFKYTLLRLAIERGKTGNVIKVVELLLDHGADINFKDARGNSLLYTAISNIDKEVVDVLLKRGVIIDYASEVKARAMATLQSIHDNPAISDKIKEDSKSILEKLEQHRLRINECAPSGSGRGKRAAGSNCDTIISEDFNSIMSRNLDEIQHSLDYLRHRMQLIHERITSTLQHVTVLDSLEQMHRRLVRNKKDFAINRSILDSIISSFDKLADEAIHHRMVIGEDVDQERVDAVEEEIHLECDNYGNTLQEILPKLDETKLLIKRVEETIKLVEEAKSVKVRLEHYTQLLKDYYNGKVDAIAVKNRFQDIQEAIAKIDLIRKDTAKSLTSDIRSTNQENADRNIKRIDCCN